MPARIRSEDEVIVIGGKDRGKRGKVLRVDPEEGTGLRRGPEYDQAPPAPPADAQRGQTAGGVIEREGPIHVSNVMLIDPKDNKPTRVGTELVDGKRVRVAKRSGQRLD